MKCVEELGQIEDLDRSRYIHGRFPWIVPEDIEKIFIPEKLRTWAEEEYERSDYRPYEKTIITSRGLAVRSKSELIIAELLYHYGIPFRYEQVIHVNEKLQIVPDFTIMCPDGTIIIWEHEGRTDKKSYMDWQRRKADYYAQLGYYPWDNLIITYDTADGNIDVRIVEAEIKNKILSKHGW